MEEFVASRAQASVGQYLMAVKSGHTGGIEEQGDIVAFPSFHVILAVLAAYYFLVCQARGIWR